MKEKKLAFLNEHLCFRAFSPLTFFTFLLFLYGFLAIQVRAASLKGKIYDKKNNESLVEATVYLLNTNYATASDENGNYTLTNIPAGKYTLEVKYIGYITYTKDIVLKKNQNLKMDIGLSENTQQLKSIAVFGKLDESTEVSSRLTEKNADNEVNVIGYKAMVSSPDINAANILQRLSGVTLQKSAGSGESYSIIRGMEPRYNNTLIDGIKIPSPNDKSRSVSLNLFPSDLLQRIMVSKTLLPDMEGDATGGTVNLVMKDAPSKPIFSIEASGGYSQILLNRKYTAFNQSVIQQKSPSQLHGINYTAKPGDFTRSNLNFKPETAPPNAMLGVTYGRRFFHNKLGVLIGDEFQNEYHGTNSVFNTIAPKPYTNNQFRKLDVTNRTISSQQLNNGLNAHFDYKLNADNELNLDNVFIYSNFAQARTSIDTSLVGNERTGPGTGYITPTYRSLTQKQYIENLELSGKHLLSNRLDLNWAAVMATAGAKEPDRADIVTFFNIRQGGARTATYFYDGNRQWQHNNDHDYTGKADLTYRALLAGDNFELKIGGLYRKKNRYNQQDLYILRPTIDPSTGVAETYTNIYKLTWTVYNPRGTAQYDNSNYSASENVGAGYVQGKLTVNKLQIIGGVRVENTREAFNTHPYLNDQATTANITYTDILPSIHFRYNLSPREDMRLSYYRSIARPGYYELVPYTQPGLYYDEKGNPNLKHTKADNFDLRYELFPDPKDQLFAGVFYKRIVDPIEYALVSSELGRSGQIVYTPENFGTAHNYGFELQFTKYLGAFGVTGNYTYTHSSISSPKVYNNNVTHTSKIVMEKRPLQGQSDNIANLSLMYHPESAGFLGQIDLQYIGNTLSKVTDYYQADYYQKPQFSLAASLQESLSHHLTIFGKFDNLLNTPSVIHINNSFTVVRNVFNASYSLGIRYTY